MNWIKVEDRLPECGERVLICGHGEVAISYLNSHEKNKYGHLEWPDGQDEQPGFYYTVTHWQPLPEQPKNDL